MHLPAPKLEDFDAIRGQALASLFESLGRLAEGAFVVDARAHIVWANQRYLNFIGLARRDKVVGRPIRELVAASRMPEVVATGCSIPLDVIEVNGQRAVVSRFPIKDDAHRVTGGLCLVLFDDVDLLQPIVARLNPLRTEWEDTCTRLDRLRRAKYDFSRFVGSSVPAMEVMLRARQVASTDATVLLQGETGTGKELMAQSIHAASRRARHNFVAVNVAAIADELMEAEFFGTGPGAFTGASPKGRLGKMALANHGTLFLDEIGDMPKHMQVKLPRALQEREIEPVGSNTVTRLDLRLIAATSRPLAELVDSGDFRADLFYRLNVVPIVMPALRERPEDIPALAKMLVDDICRSLGLAPRPVQPAAMQALVAHNWPGNVRELRNVLERACVIGAVTGITPEALQLSPPARPGIPLRAPRMRRAIDALEHDLIQDAMQTAKGNKLAAARSLGISRSHLYRKLEQLELHTPAARPGSPASVRRRGR